MQSFFDGPLCLLHFFKPEIRKRSEELLWRGRGGKLGQIGLGLVSMWLPGGGEAGRVSHTCATSARIVHP